MVHQKPFAVEQYMDKYENDISHNMGETCVESLTLNEVVAFAGDHVRDSVREKLFDTQLTYGNIRGSPELKQQIVELYDDPTLTTEHVVITNGAIGANFLSFYAVVNPGDRVVVVTPSYQQLALVPEMFGATVESWPMEMSNEYAPDLEWLDRTFALKHTKLLVINNPNNPTGFVWETPVLEKIAALCDKHDVALMCDEVYRPLFHFAGGSEVKLAVELGHAKTLVTGSMSKAFSLAGIRLGWIVTKHEPFLKNIYEKRDYNTISVSILDDAVATVALKHCSNILRRNLAICAENLAIIDNLVRKSDGRISWVKPRGGSTCFVKLNNVENTMALASQLAENERLLVVPGEVFDKPGWLRIGYGNDTRHIRAGCEILDRVVREA